MLVIDILKAKEGIVKNGCELGELKFTNKEIEVLRDKNQLRVFKLDHEFPEDFESSFDILECVERVKKGDNIYRTLELCVMYNRILKRDAKIMFPKLLWEK